MANNLNDVIDPRIKFSIEESASEVDGKYILAKVKGQFFCPDGKSRNGRFYSRELWERVIENPTVQQSLKKRLMFGTVGHDADLGEKAIREGIVSHIMSNIYIDDKGQGIGEALILNTPVGSVLNTLLRSGCELYVSSRANGDFNGKREGLPNVNPETYDLSGWDFVIDPGFLEANPKLAESYNKYINKLDEDDNSNGDKSMDKILVEHITTENSELKSQVVKLQEEIASLKESNDVIFEENKHLKSEVSTLEETQVKLKKYEELGEPEDLEKAIDLGDEAADELEKYKALGNPEDIKETLTSAKNYIAKLHKNIGTYKVIESSLKKAISFQEAVGKIGTLKEIRDLANRFEFLLKESEDQEAENKAKALADELEMDIEKVKELLQKYSVEDIKAMHAEMKASISEKMTKKKPVTETKTNQDKYKKPITESKEDEEVVVESKIIGRSLVESLNEKYNR